VAIEIAKAMRLDPRSHRHDGAAGEALDRAGIYRPRLRDLRAGGLGSLPGMLLGAMLLGIIESFTATFYGRPGRPRSRSGSCC